MKKYRLLKDTYDGMKAGTILTLTGEPYRDSQRYSYVWDSSSIESVNPKLLSKECVENNPEWFEEIKEPNEYEGYGKRVRSWEEIIEWSGYYINNSSGVRKKYAIGTIREYKNISATENIAKSQLAQSQLSQLLVQYWGDWNVRQGDKYYPVSLFSDGKINNYGFEVCGKDGFLRHFLSFPTAKMRDDFLEDHKDLISDYFLMHEWPNE